MRQFLFDIGNKIKNMKLKRSVNIIVYIVKYRKTIDIKMTKKNALDETTKKLGMGEDKIIKIILRILSC